MFFTVDTGYRLPPPQVSRSVVIISDILDTSSAHAVDYPYHFPADPNTDLTVQIIYEVEVLFGREDTYLYLKNRKKKNQYNSKEWNTFLVFWQLKNFTVSHTNLHKQFFKIADPDYDPPDVENPDPRQ
jgi:hypothetical protein